jgi:hypothetical protein
MITADFFKEDKNSCFKNFMVSLKGVFFYSFEVFIGGLRSVFFYSSEVFIGGLRSKT